MPFSLTAPMFGTYMALQHMRKDKGGQGGQILNVARVHSWSSRCPRHYCKNLNRYGFFIASINEHDLNYYSLLNALKWCREIRNLIPGPLMGVQNQAKVTKGHQVGLQIAKTVFCTLHKSSFGQIKFTPYKFWWRGISYFQAYPATKLDFARVLLKQSKQVNGT